MWNANQDDDELDLRFQNVVCRLRHLNGTVLHWNVNCVLFWFLVVSIFSLWATALLNTYCFSCCAHFTNWYIYLLDNEISTLLYCTSVITPWRTQYLQTARLSIGSTSYIRNPWWFMFHAEAFFYKCPLSRLSVKQLLGSHVPLLLDNVKDCNGLCHL